MQEIGDNRIIIATAKPELVLFDLLEKRIIREFNLDTFPTKDHFVDNIYPLGPYSFITTLDSEIWTYWDTRKEDPIQSDEITNSVIMYVAPMPASKRILICYNVFLKEKSSTQYGLYDLEKSSFVTTYTLKKALPLLTNIYSEPQGLSLFIMPSPYGPGGSIQLLEIHPQKNGYSFVEESYSLPHNLRADCITTILMPFPSSQKQLLIYKPGKVELYTINPQKAFQFVAKLGGNGFSIGNDPYIKKVNNTVVIYAKENIIRFALS
ncbi:MAG: hypothetical protein AAF770_01530 [Bacteroidota bacterium]